MGLAGVHCFKVAQSIIYCRDIDGAVVTKIEGRIQLQFRCATTALLGLSGDRVIRENPSHHPGSDGEKLEAIAPINGLLIEQPQIRFVDERRGLEGVIRPLAPQIIRGQLPQLIVNGRQRRIHGRIFTAAAQKTIKRSQGTVRSRPSVVVPSGFHAKTLVGRISLSSPGKFLKIP